jgi:hypothetical protein
VCRTQNPWLLLKSQGQTLGSAQNLCLEHNFYMQGGLLMLGMSGKFIYFLIFYSITIHSLYKFCQGSYAFMYIATLYERLLNVELRFNPNSSYIQHIYIVMEHFDNVNSVKLTSRLQIFQFLLFQHSWYQSGVYLIHVLFLCHYFMNFIYYWFPYSV